MVLVDLVANLAAILTIISFLTGISICRNIYRAGSTADISPLPFLVGTSCGFLWLRYGLLLNDPVMIFVNTIGLTLQTIYLIWFYIFTGQKNQLNYRLVALITFILSIHLYINYSLDPESLIGLLACLSSLFLSASPLPAVFQALETKSTEKLPFSLIFSLFLGYLMWFIYGYLISNVFVQIPNGISTFISGFQLSLFLIYPSRAKTNLNKTINHF